MDALDKSFIITYSNHFKVDDKIFAFRKKELFEISNVPTWVQLQYHSGSKGYWINRKWFSLSKIKELIVNEEIKVDVSDLQWYIQEQLEGVFNLMSA